MDYIELAEMAQAGLNQRFDIAHPADIALDEDRLTGALADGVHGLLATCLVYVCDHNPGPFAGKELGRCPANSGGCAGDQGYFFC